MTVILNYLSGLIKDTDKENLRGKNSVSCVAYEVDQQIGRSSEVNQTLSEPKDSP